MTIDIDFLPSSYRERNAQLKLWFWRSAVIACLVVAVSVAHVLQQRQCLAAKQQAAQARSFRLDAQSRSQQLASLQQQLAELRQFAELYTYLCHPWPRTQILAEIVRPLPSSIRLAEISISNEAAKAKSDNAQGLRPLPRSESDTKSEDPNPAQSDLATLRETRDPAATVAELVGETRDPTALHAYLAQLAASPLIATAALKSMEAAPTSQTPPTSTFRVRLVVRRGYGQVGGATEPLSRVAPAMEEGTRVGGTMGSTRRVELREAAGKVVEGVGRTMGSTRRVELLGRGEWP